MKLFASKPLFCSQGHRWGLFRAWPSPDEHQRLVCPKCQEPLRVAVPVDRAKVEARQESKVGLKVTAVSLALFPGLVLLTWLSVSRWGVNELAASPDGNTLAVARTTIDGGARLQLWDLSAQRQVAKRGGEGERIFGNGGDLVCAPHFTPDGKTLLLAQQETQPAQDGPGNKAVGTVFKWDFATGKEPMKLGTFPARVCSLALDQQAKMLVVAGTDQTVQLWDFATGKEQGSFKHRERIVCQAVDADSAFLATGTMSGELWLWDLRKKDLKERFRAHRSVVKGLAFDPTGQVLASVGGLDQTVKLWDVRTGERQGTFRLKDLDWLTCVAFAPDGRRLAVGGGSFRGRGQVQLWDLEAGREAVFFVDTNTAICATFTRDGKTLLAGSGHATSIATWDRQGRVHAWDLATGAETQSIPSSTTAAQ